MPLLVAFPDVWSSYMVIRVPFRRSLFVKRIDLSSLMMMQAGARALAWNTWSNNIRPTAKTLARVLRGLIFLALSLRSYVTPHILTQASA